jgi:UDP-N-acetylmuramoyl-L-alanyl-D-glutamate--2,6-diaminopimelate ligase
MNPRKVVKSLLPKRLFQTIEPFGHLVESALFATMYGFPGKKLRVIGVTGTNGKTTTSFMIHRMLTEAGHKTALMTTVANGIGNDIVPQVAHMTTVSAPKLQRQLAEFAKAGVDFVVLETTSHALAQHRIFGVNYEVAVLTNITHEHLDYHRTFERYVEAKRRLFRLANKNPLGFGVVNADDPSNEKFVASIKHSSTYGIEKGDLQATALELDANGSQYKIQVGDTPYNITCHIPGEFNVYNSLATVAVGRHLGLSREQIEQGIAALKSVEGRMNTIDEGQAFTVVIDFAHTPDSFERLLSDLRKHTKGKLVVLFGSAGRRDETKRWTQGEIAGKYADELVLTEEDDRDIDGNLILSQIAEGAARSGKIKDKDMFLVLDRTEAINFAMTRVSAADDTVVLLGKGHEKTIERADGEHPWDEATAVTQAIRETSVSGNE